MTLTPALLAASAAAAAAVASCGQMIRTLMPLLISDSTLAFSLALSLWLKSGSQPAFWKTAWSCSQRGSSFVGSTTPTSALLAGSAGAVVATVAAVASGAVVAGAVVAWAAGVGWAAGAGQPASKVAAMVKRAMTDR